MRIRLRRTWMWLSPLLAASHWAATDPPSWWRGACGCSPPQTVFLIRLPCAALPCPTLQLVTAADPSLWLHLADEAMAFEKRYAVQPALRGGLRTSTQQARPLGCAVPRSEQLLRVWITQQHSRAMLPDARPSWSQVCPAAWRQPGAARGGGIPGCRPSRLHHRTAVPAPRVAGACAQLDVWLGGIVGC